MSWSTSILAKFFGETILDDITEVVDPLLLETEKHKQRAGAEILAGILRGKFSFKGALLKPAYRISENYRVETLDYTIAEEAMVVDNCQARSHCGSNQAGNDLIMGISISGKPPRYLSGYSLTGG